jgi:hypothetical protein
MTCSLALAAMSAAVISHWWSLEKFTAAMGDTPALAAPPSPVITPVASQIPITDTAASASSQSTPAPTASPSAAQKEFFEVLLDEVKQLKKSNLALRDQMAETNRDLMKLEFRVDTHSESFRPLPVTEDVSTLDTSTLDTSTFDSSAPGNSAGVLPPRAVLVGQPGAE